MHAALKNIAGRINGALSELEGVDPGWQGSCEEREVSVHGLDSVGVVFQGHGMFSMRIGQDGSNSPATRQPLSVNGVDYRGSVEMGSEGGMHVRVYEGTSYANHPVTHMRRTEAFSLAEPTPAAQKRLGIRYRREGRYDDGLLIELAEEVKRVMGDEWDLLDKQATERADLNNLHRACEQAADKLQEALETLS
jgi:hypothetical protein